MGKLIGKGPVINRANSSSLHRTTKIERELVDIISFWPQALGLDPLKTMLKSVGGWPLLEGPAWREENFTWSECKKSLKLLWFLLA